MRNVLCKIISIMLICSLVVGSSQKVHAEENAKYVFVDGLEYKVVLDENKNIHIACITPGYEGEMAIDENLNGEISMNGDEQYEIEVNNLNYDMETVDIVISEDGETVEEYNSFDEVIQDEYCGQMAIAAGGTIAIGGFVTALLYACLAVTVAGVVCYAVDAVIDDVRKKSKYYYKAYRMYNTVFINPNAITRTAAVSRIASGSDTYTFTSSQAKGIVKSTGLGVTSSENHWAWYKIGSFFNHYHTANRNGAHSFYGIPK